jgi:hypothetical protein
MAFSGDPVGKREGVRISLSLGVHGRVALFSFLPPYRILMARVYESTRSLLLAILMHASLTTCMIIFGPAVTGNGAMVYDVVFGSVLWLVVAATTPRARVRRLTEARL